MPRVPLPLKAFLAFLLVLGAGTLPMLLYVNGVARADLLENRQQDLTARLLRLAQITANMPADERVTRLKEISKLTPDRITLVAGDGRVLFDSRVAVLHELDHHGNRPEVREAIAAFAADQRKSTTTKRKATKKKSLHKPRWPVASAHRHSKTLGSESQYVALRLPGPEALVLRLSRQSQDIDALTQRSLLFWRNAEALAISLALLLSLVAAMVLVRPMRRLQTSVEKLTDGDYSAIFDEKRWDEVGDLAVGFSKLATQLRKRAAKNSTTEAVLAQLVEVLPGPVAVYEPGGELLAINGAARVLLHVEGPSAGERVRRLQDHPVVKAAAERAGQEGTPEHIEVTLKGGVEIEATVHVLRRPGDQALHVLFASETMVEGVPLSLPNACDVTPHSLVELIETATKEVQASVQDIKISVPSRVPEVDVANVQGSLEQALQLALEGCAESFHGDELRFDVEVNGTRVGLAFDATLPAKSLEAIRPLLEPMGGAVDIAPGEVTLWFPRA
ncbi:MAG: HAMP domain-containing protein [Deltaproteobacteria bacterium]|nr:HAMP domain-containing protein [Deltaproteobacteria bacterium]